MRKEDTLNGRRRTIRDLRLLYLIFRKKAIFFLSAAEECGTLYTDITETEDDPCVPK